LGSPTGVKMIIAILLAILLLLEYNTSRKYKSELEDCYRLLIKQQQHINNIENELRKKNEL
jgi:hypothetical protein